MKKAYNQSERAQDLQKLVTSYCQILLSLFLIILGLAISFFCYKSPSAREQSTVNDLITCIGVAIGTSIAASGLFYVIYSRFAEEQVMNKVAEYATKTAIDQISIYQKWNLCKVFESSAGTNLHYLRAFRDAVKQSEKYWFKGNTGYRITYWISKWAHNNIPLESVTFVFLDPRINNLYCDLAVRNHQKHTCQKRSKNPESEHQLALEIQEELMKLYVSLVTLAEINHPKFEITVFFHEDRTSIRSEIFSNGIFIAYYFGYDDDNDEHHQFYVKDSMTYRAYSYDFDLVYSNRAKAALTIQKGGERKSDSEIETILNCLGCKASLSDIRKEKNKRDSQIPKADRDILSS